MLMVLTGGMPTTHSCLNNRQPTHPIALSTPQSSAVLVQHILVPIFREKLPRFMNAHLIFLSERPRQLFTNYCITNFDNNDVCWHAHKPALAAYYNILLSVFAHKIKPFECRFIRGRKIDKALFCLSFVSACYFTSFFLISKYVCSLSFFFFFLSFFQLSFYPFYYLDIFPKAKLLKF